MSRYPPAMANDDPNAGNMPAGSSGAAAPAASHSPRKPSRFQNSPSTSHLQVSNDSDSETAVIASDPTNRYERYAQCLGKGAYKEVYKAFDQEESVEVAWNQLRVDHLTNRDAAKVTAEVKLLQSLDHPNVIKCYHVWTAPDDTHRRNVKIYFITELMTSGTLRAFIKRSKAKVKPKVLKNWCRQILDGLGYLHERGIIHRDLKCENVFINGNNGVAKIGDLGLATIKKREHLSSVLGTPEFMAPELYEEKYDEKADIYSFGMCVLELATKDYPYAECENQAQIFKKVISGIKPLALSRVEDAETREFIELCLTYDPKARPSVADLVKHEFLKGVTGKLGTVVPGVNQVIGTAGGTELCRSGSLGNSSSSSLALPEQQQLQQSLCTSTEAQSFTEAAAGMSSLALSRSSSNPSLAPTSVSGQPPTGTTITNTTSSSSEKLPFPLPTTLLCATSTAAVVTAPPAPPQSDQAATHGSGEPSLSDLVVLTERMRQTSLSTQSETNQPPTRFCEPLHHHYHGPVTHHVDPQQSVSGEVSLTGTQSLPRSRVMAAVSPTLRPIDLPEYAAAVCEHCRVAISRTEPNTASATPVRSAASESLKGTTAATAPSVLEKAALEAANMLPLERSSEPPRTMPLATLEKTSRPGEMTNYSALSLEQPSMARSANDTLEVVNPPPMLAVGCSHSHTNLGVAEEMSVGVPRAIVSNRMWVSVQPVGFDKESLAVAMQMIISFRPNGQADSAARSPSPLSMSPQTQQTQQPNQSFSSLSSQSKPSAAMNEPYATLDVKFPFELLSDSLTAIIGEMVGEGIVWDVTEQERAGLEDRLGRVVYGDEVCRWVTDSLRKACQVACVSVEAAILDEEASSLEEEPLPIARDRGQLHVSARDEVRWLLKCARKLSEERQTTVQEVLSFVDPRAHGEQQSPITVIPPATASTNTTTQNSEATLFSPQDPVHHMSLQHHAHAVGVEDKLALQECQPQPHVQWMLEPLVPEASTPRPNSPPPLKVYHARLDRKRAATTPSTPTTGARIARRRSATAAPISSGTGRYPPERDIPEIPHGMVGFGRHRSKSLTNSIPSNATSPSFSKHVTPVTDSSVASYRLAGFGPGANCGYDCSHALGRDYPTLSSFYTHPRQHNSQFHNPRQLHHHHHQHQPYSAEFSVHRDYRLDDSGATGPPGVGTHRVFSYLKGHKIKTSNYPLYTDYFGERSLNASTVRRRRSDRNVSRCSSHRSPHHSPRSADHRRDRSRRRQSVSSSDSVRDADTEDCAGGSWGTERRYRMGTWQSHSSFLEESSVDITDDFYRQQRGSPTVAPHPYPHPQLATQLYHHSPKMLSPRQRRRSGVLYPETHVLDERGRHFPQQGMSRIRKSSQASEGMLGSSPRYPSADYVLQQVTSDDSSNEESPYESPEQARYRSSSRSLKYRTSTMHNSPLASNRPRSSKSHYARPRGARTNPSMHESHSAASKYDRSEITGFESSGDASAENEGSCKTPISGSTRSGRKLRSRSSHSSGSSRRGSYSGPRNQSRQGTAKKPQPTHPALPAHSLMRLKTLEGHPNEDSGDEHVGQPYHSRQAMDSESSCQSQRHVSRSNQRRRDSSPLASSHGSSSVSSRQLPTATGNTNSSASATCHTDHDALSGQPEDAATSSSARRSKAPSNGTPEHEHEWNPWSNEFSSKWHSPDMSHHDGRIRCGQGYEGSPSASPTARRNAWEEAGRGHESGRTHCAHPMGEEEMYHDRPLMVNNPHYRPGCATSVERSMSSYTGHDEGDDRRAQIWARRSPVAAQNRRSMTDLEPAAVLVQGDDHGLAYNDESFRRGASFPRDVCRRGRDEDASYPKEGACPHSVASAEAPSLWPLPIPMAPDEKSVEAATPGDIDRNKGDSGLRMCATSSGGESGAATPRGPGAGVESGNLLDRVCTAAAECDSSSPTCSRS